MWIMVLFTKMGKTRNGGQIAIKVKTKQNRRIVVKFKVLICWI